MNTPGDPKVQGRVAQPRNRIKRHARVRAGDLVPHELNADFREA